ncbi:MAG: cell division protein FtsX [Kiloniellaceae bacterium]
MLFRRGDLPLNRDASGRFLPWLVAIMVYLAALALVSAMAMNKLVQRWDQGLSGRITVQIPPAVPGGAAGEAADPIDPVLRLLTGTPGVRRAEVLEPDEISQLLEPWLGTGAAAQDLPMPTLIAVTIDPAAETDLKALARQVAQAAPGATLDDHQRWLGNLLDLARSIELVAALVVLLVGVSAVTMVVFVTRMGLAVHGQVIELLHLIGAQDSYVAREFQSHASKLALRGGVLGLVLAVLTVVSVGRVLGPTEAALLPNFALLPIEWTLLAVLPLAVAAVAMLTARLTVLRTLARMP